MTEKRYSPAEQAYKIQTEWTTEIRMEMDKGIASFLLILPMGMSYELWRYLHQVKGDWIE